jgi:FlaA1/EpsC-like NDP-sugar epimerase
VNGRPQGATRWTGWLRLARAAADFAVMAAAFATACALRFDFSLPPWGTERLLSAFAAIVAVQYAALFAFGCYRVVWRFVGVYDLPRFVFAAASSTAVMIGLRFLLPGNPLLRPSFSIALMNGALFLSGLLMTRVLWRLARERPAPAPCAGAEAPRPRRLLLLGAGSAGNTVARELRQSGGDLVLVGFLDDDPARRDTVIQGVPVLGTIDDLGRILAARGVDEAIVTITRAPPELVRRVVHACEARGVAVRMVPRYRDVIDGSVSVSRLRDVEIGDLLGREEIDLGGEAKLARFLNGRSVMVTGAGGSIGRELARQVARAGARRLVLLERSEYALYEAHRDIAALVQGETLDAVLADVGDAVRMRAVFQRCRPDVVLHAAAHKHVPLIESHACEAIQNNVLATRLLGEISAAQGVDVFVLLSTDKAVNPCSVMGATKRLAEIALQDLNAEGRTRFSAVRFGNVLGASGSVIPLFQEQIRRGGPVTVTHPDMRRFFMTIPEAVRLVLQATILAAGGEIFVLDMGEPVRIVELAEEMIRLSGLQPYRDIAVTFVGPRPGEKLTEELSTAEESVGGTAHPRIFAGRLPLPPREAVRAELDRLAGLCRAGDDDTARQHLLAGRAAQPAVGGR